MTTGIKYNPSPEDLAQFEAWLAERPAIAEVARAHSPFHCYRLKDHNPKGHYSIHAYDELEDGVALTLRHGRDSTLPGVGVFGIKPEELIVCDCGKWEFPRLEQLEEQKKKIERIARNVRKQQKRGQA